MRMKLSDEFFYHFGPTSITFVRLQFGEYLVPKGTSVVASILHMHRNPEHWPEPDVFDPDRFQQVGSV